MKDRTVLVPKTKDPKIERERALIKREEDIVKAYKSGKSINSIEIDFHISHQYIQKIFKKYKIQRRDKDWMKKKCYDLLKTGDYSVKVMAEKLNLNQNSIRADISYWGLYRYKCQCDTGFIYTLDKKKKQNI